MSLIKNLLIGLAKNAAEEVLVEIIEKAELKNPKAVKAFEDAIRALLPVLQDVAEDTTTKLDDKAVEFLAELLDKLKANDPVTADAWEDEDDDGDGVPNGIDPAPSDPHTPPPGGPTP